ncbi:RNA polymerase sigma factor [candidate division WOR-3 bacterium]|nr:RNA polymerase sigma factor [candidate division WOR-3 bacterium]
MKGDEDEILVAAFKQGDEKAFDRLFEKYRLPVYSVCYRFLRSDADTQEVVLDIFTKIFHNIQKFNEKSKFFTWMYRIAVNTSLSFKRSHKARAITSDPITISRSLEERIHMKVAINDALNNLPERQRMCFILRYYEGYTYREIGDIMRITSGAVKAHHHHAVKKLRHLLKGWL